MEKDEEMGKGVCWVEGEVGGWRGEGLEGQERRMDGWMDGEEKDGWIDGWMDE